MWISCMLIPIIRSCVLATLTENIQDHRAAWKTRLFYSFSLKLHYSGFSAACNLLQTLNLSRPVGRTDFLPEFYLSKKAQYSVHHSMSVRVKAKELLLLKSLTGWRAIELKIIHSLPFSPSRFAFPSTLYKQTWSSLIGQFGNVVMSPASLVLNRPPWGNQMPCITLWGNKGFFFFFFSYYVKSCFSWFNHFLMCDCKYTR